MLRNDGEQVFVEMGRGDLLFVSGVYRDVGTGKKMAMIGMSNSFGHMPSGTPIPDSEAMPNDQDLVLVWYDKESMKRFAQILETMSERI